jgi:putative endonuclease
MASRSLTLYIGVTGDLRSRVLQHKLHCYPESFTAKYKVERLVYYERYTDVGHAIAREKQLKSWRRDKKLALIKRDNPAWADLAENWYSPATLTGKFQTGPVCRFTDSRGAAHVAARTAGPSTSLGMTRRVPEDTD